MFDSRVRIRMSAEGVGNGWCAASENGAQELVGLYPSSLEPDGEPVFLRVVAVYLDDRGISHGTVRSEPGGYGHRSPGGNGECVPVEVDVVRADIS